MNKPLETIERGNYNVYFATPNGEVVFPLNIKVINYATHIDLENKSYVEGMGNVESDLPTINDLLDSGELVQHNYIEEVDLQTNKFPHRPSYKKWMEYFKERGFNVTREALKHNYEAWSMDLKSGYRDEENNYFLFTPCGCNPLSFNVTRLDEHLDWQETYGHPFMD